MTHELVAYAFFGAPDLGTLERQGSTVPDLLTAVLVLVFAVFAFYAFANCKTYKGNHFTFLRF